MKKYLIAGLGNPGHGYRKNRHNAGFIVIDRIAGEFGLKISKRLYDSKSAVFRSKNGEHIMIKPQLYMNNSGIPIGTIIYREKIPVENIVILYDDIDLPFGTIRFRNKGSAGTHNGMRSVIRQLGTEDIKRVRIGIGKPESETGLTGYVLGDFSKQQLETLKEEISKEIMDKLFEGFLYESAESR